MSRKSKERNQELLDFMNDGTPPVVYEPVSSTLGTVYESGPPFGKTVPPSPSKAKLNWLAWLTVAVGLTAALFLVLASLASLARAQCGPYGQYPCYAPRPYYAAERPPKPPLPAPLPCPNCGSQMVPRQVFRPGAGWITIWTCINCPLN